MKTEKEIKQLRVHLQRTLDKLGELLLTINDVGLADYIAREELRRFREIQVIHWVLEDKDND